MSSGAVGASQPTKRQLLEHLLVAAACLVAQTQDVTPRGVFEQFFRRSVSDDEWRDRYAPLLG